MLVCLLLFTELLILHLFIRYVILRQPREYRVDKDIWGLYEMKKNENRKAGDVTIVFSNRLNRGFRVIKTGKATTDDPNDPGRRAA